MPPVTMPAPYPANTETVTVNPAKTKVTGTKAVDFNQTDVPAGGTVKIHKSAKPALQKVGIIP
jgi:hypothetical protein